jgi:hypothetical protein
VHTGTLLVRRGREQIRVATGEDVRIPPRVVHTFKAEDPPLSCWGIHSRRSLVHSPSCRSREPARPSLQVHGIGSPGNGW